MSVSQSPDNISFFSEEVDFEHPDAPRAQAWIAQIAAAEQASISDLNYIFCSDQYLHSINVQYLDHDNYTDIITFDNSGEEDVIESDIFISIDRIGENAQTYGVPFGDELTRVMAHGVLHLLGYGDKTESEKLKMREKEDYWKNRY